MEELEKRKNEIETEVNELMEFLNSCGENVGLNGKLIDNEGFPRSDIDLYAVRKARHRIAILNTDYSQLMKEIEEKLFEIHAKERINVPITKSKTIINEENKVKYPFGIVDDVLKDSPAYSSGIKKGDILIDFGGLHTKKELLSQSESKDLISQLSSIILNNLNNSISVIILRTKHNDIEEVIKKYTNDVNRTNLTYNSIDSTQFEETNLKLIPKEWQGSGYLGCHIAYFYKRVEETN